KNLLATKTNEAPTTDERMTAIRASISSTSTKSVREAKSRTNPIPPHTANFHIWLACVRRQRCVRRDMGKMIAEKSLFVDSFFVLRNVHSSKNGETKDVR